MPRESIHIKLIESDFDTFEFQRAYIGERDGAPLPIADVSGVPCNIETKPGPLQDGLAFCEPLDHELAVDWPVSVLIEVDGHQERRFKMTAQPRIVAAARRFFELLSAGQAQPGMAL